MAARAGVNLSSCVFVPHARLLRLLAFSSVLRLPSLSAGNRTQVGAGKPGQWTVEDATTFSKKCDPYEQGGKPLDADQALELMNTLDSSWVLSDDRKMLRREVQTMDLVAAAEFFRRIAIVAQNEGQAPFRTSIENTQGRGAPHVVSIELYTPRLKGLSFADFMLALKIGFLPPP